MKIQNPRVDEHEHKKIDCASIVNKPGIIIKYIEQDWYDETIIKGCYLHHITSREFLEKPMICVKVLRALRKQRMNEKFMQKSPLKNVHFAFEQRRP